MKFGMAGSLIVAGTLLFMGCKKSEEAAQTNPHSLDGVMDQIIQQARLLDEAAKRKDFKFVHDYGYYVKNLAQALYSHLDDGQKVQAQKHLTEILKVINQLDAASGRAHEAATLAGTQRLSEILNELDTQLRPGRKPSTGQRSGRNGFDAMDRQTAEPNHLIQSNKAL